MRVLLVNDSTSNPNWGDRAASVALQTMIAAAGGEIIYSLSEGALGATTFDHGGLGLEDPRLRRLRDTARPLAPPLLAGVVRRVAGRRSSVPLTWEGFPSAAETLFSKRTAWPSLTKALSEADVVVIHGDGAMTGNGIIPRTMLFLTYVAKTYYGKPVTIVNHTADFSDPVLREIAVNVYPMFDDVVFREPLSVERCRGVCDGRYAADTAFMFEPAPRSTWLPIAKRPTYFDVWPDSASFDPSEPYLCIGGSSLLGTVRDTTAATAGYKAMIEHIRLLYYGAIVLTVSDLRDQPVFRRIAHELGLPLVALYSPIQQAIDVLGNADAYVGGRWHPSIFALRGGTPVIPLSAKTDKMAGLARMLGLAWSPPNVLDLAPSIGFVGQRLRDSLAGADELRAELRAWSQEQARSCWANVDYARGR